MYQTYSNYYWLFCSMKSESWFFSLPIPRPPGEGWGEPLFFFLPVSSEGRI
jgi:hypothetical protein